MSEKKSPHISDKRQDALCRSVVDLTREVLKTNTAGHRNPVSDCPSLLSVEDFVIHEFPGALEQSVRDEYGFDVGDQVVHVKGGGPGYVIEIDSDCDLGGVTTARVVWNVSSFEEAKNTPREDSDIQWTNKLRRVELTNQCVQWE